VAKNGEQVIPFFAYPKAVRKIIYTTNTIESLNMSLRKIIKNRGHFPSDDAATKLLYLALRNAAKKWTVPSCSMIVFHLQYIEDGKRQNRRLHRRSDTTAGMDILEIKFPNQFDISQVKSSLTNYLNSSTCNSHKTEKRMTIVHLLP